MTIVIIGGQTAPFSAHWALRLVRSSARLPVTGMLQVILFFILIQLSRSTLGGGLLMPPGSIKNVVESRRAALLPPIGCTFAVAVFGDEGNVNGLVYNLLLESPFQQK